MTNQIVLLHGWSATSKSMSALVPFLQSQGFDVASIWLGDYLSMDDDVRIEDAARGMDRAIREKLLSGELKAPFDLIVHSTGGLVSREWVITRSENGEDCPVKRIVMLAPANFGSKLAHTGKSMVGRLTVGLKNGFQTGEQMLRGLELASEYQWRLARRDLFRFEAGDNRKPYGPGAVLPFVITGTHPYASGLQQIVNENGSDGTVRAAAANLNAEGFSVEFPDEPEDTAGLKAFAWTKRFAGKFPCAVLPERDHSTIVDPTNASGTDSVTAGVLPKLIVQALRCTDAQYGAVESEWANITAATAELGDKLNKARVKAMFPKSPPDEEPFHEFMQICILVRDSQGLPVPDYFLEFYDPDQANVRSREAAMREFHKNVLEHVHTNTIDKSRRCFFVDRTDLFKVFYTGGRIRLGMSITAADPGENIWYFSSRRNGAGGRLLLHAKDDADRQAIGASRLHRNQTHLVDLVIPRQPNDKVFKLSRPK